MERPTFERNPGLRKGWLSLGILLLVSGVLVLSARASSEQSSCLSCHTDSRKLIRLSQDILKKHPPVKSEAIKGEG
ncbi:MAG: hypothetical protein JRH07_13225 [Deltaproteobacteria bacterium]|nr:hypothetical protein [Deltaproteobacteria bacterium]MBW2122786.1 hypothetical protein [Deltaproteobacteria bacterium]